MLPAGHVLQRRYRIVRQLGKGGMGTVYEAADERLGIPVALKHNHFDDERLAKQFEREAHILAKLRHQALPRVMDHFQDAGGQFLIMEFVGGPDLARAVELRGGPFEVEAVLGWTDQLLDALHYLHTQPSPILHRDIKPQNLKLWSENQIVLLDFGLAKDVTLASRINTSGSIFGYTPNYAPLEQIQGSGTDRRSDLYSLAATCYHLVTGAPPPDVLTRVAATTDGGADPLQPLHAVRERVPAGVSEVIFRALSIGRSARFATAAEMRAALRAATPAPAAFVVPPTIAEVRDTQSAAAPAPDQEAAPTMPPAPPAPPASISTPPIAVSTIAFDPVAERASAGSPTNTPLAPDLRPSVRTTENDTDGRTGARSETADEPSLATAPAAPAWSLRGAIVALAAGLAMIAFFWSFGRDAGVMLDVAATIGDSATLASKAETDRTVDVLKARLQDLSVTESDVSSDGPGRIKIEMRGAADEHEATATLLRSGRVEFAIVAGGPTPDVRSLLPPSGEIPEPLRVVSARASDPAGAHGVYLVERVPALTGEDLADVSPTINPPNQPAIRLGLTPNGFNKLRTVMASNVAERLGIVVDDVVIAAPVIESVLTAPEVRISGFTRDEAEELVTILQSRELPTTVTVTRISPLAAEGGPAIRRGAIAAGIFLVGISVFLLVSQGLRPYRARRGPTGSYEVLRGSNDHESV